MKKNNTMVYMVRVDENEDYVRIMTSKEKVAKAICEYYADEEIWDYTEEEIIEEIAKREKENYFYCFITDEEKCDGATFHVVKVVVE